MSSSYIEGVFPSVHWTGGSSIHKSLYRAGDLPELGPEDAIALIRQSKIPAIVWSILQKNFGAFEEWLISDKELESLLVIDCWRHLTGKPDSFSEDKIINPATGNEFHRIALGHSLVGGIRFWCDYMGSGNPNFGFRFRIVNQDEENSETTVRIRRRLLAVMEELEALEEQLFDVKEPSAKSINKIQQLEMEIA